MAKKLDWGKIWDEFDTWYQARDKANYCKHCEQTHYDQPEWEEQAKAIQRIVNKELARG